MPIAARPRNWPQALRLAATAIRYVPTPASTRTSGYENQTPTTPKPAIAISRREAVDDSDSDPDSDPAQAASWSAIRVSIRSHEYCLISAE